MGACLQAPHCCIQTMTDGNAPCSLINLYISVLSFNKILQGNISTFMIDYDNMSYYSEN